MCDDQIVPDVRDKEWKQPQQPWYRDIIFPPATLPDVLFQDDDLEELPSHLPSSSLPLRKPPTPPSTPEPNQPPLLPSEDRVIIVVCPPRSILRPTGISEPSSLDVPQCLRTSPTGSYYKCLKCPPEVKKVFKHRSGLSRHVTNKHLGYTKKCPKCQKTFTRSDSLADHLRRVHFMG